MKEEKLEKINGLDEKIVFLKLSIDDKRVVLPKGLKSILKKEEIKTIADLVAKQPGDLLKIKGFGRRTYFKLDDLLALYDFSWGMDVDGFIGAANERIEKLKTKLLWKNKTGL